MSPSAPVIQGDFPSGLSRLAMRQPVQAKSAPHAALHRPHDASALLLPPALTAFHHGPGHALPPLVRQPLEAAFGASFADVRLHVGSHPSSLGATAFTHGANIHFGAGQCNPETAHGQQMFCRQLARVVQQRSGRVRNPFGGGIAVVQDRMLDLEADRIGRAAADRLAMSVRPKLASRGPIAGRDVLQPLPWWGWVAIAGLVYGGYRWLTSGGQADALRDLGERGRRLEQIDGRSPYTGLRYTNEVYARNRRHVAADLELDDGYRDLDDAGRIAKLFRLFTRRRFRYSMAAGGFDRFAQRNGDCKTLTDSFQLIAAQEFGIPTRVGAENRPFLTRGRQTIDPDARGNCDNGTNWFFSNHYWIEYGGEEYDVLFGAKGVDRRTFDITTTHGDLRSDTGARAYWRTQAGDYVWENLPLAQGPDPRKYKSGDLRALRGDGYDIA